VRINKTEDIYLSTHDAYLR